MVILQREGWERGGEEGEGEREREKVGVGKEWWGAGPRPPGRNPGMIAAMSSQLSLLEEYFDQSQIHDIAQVIIQAISV